MENFYKLSIFLMVLVTVGCNQLEQQPEKKDLIFNAINYELNEEKIPDLKRQETEVRRAGRALKKLSPHDPDFAFMKQEMTAKSRSVAKLRQQVRLLELQRESRVKYVRKKTLEAYKKGETWNGREEYEYYKKARDQRLTSKDWRSRIPKMYDPQSELIDEDRVAAAKKAKEREIAIEAASK